MVVDFGPEQLSLPQRDVAPSVASLIVQEERVASCAPSTVMCKFINSQVSGTRFKKCIHLGS
jgi:hypothetical protein